MTTIIASAIISAITAKIVATYYFKEVDGYVREMNPNIHYARIVKFDICERFDMLDDMRQIIKFFEQPEYKNKYHNNIISFKAILLAKEGQIDEAVDYFRGNIRDYTEDAKDKFIVKLERYKE